MMIKNKLLILFLLININSLFGHVLNLGLVNLMNLISIHNITKKDVLDNKQYNHIKIKDYIVKVHREVNNFNHDFRKNNVKLFHTTLSRLGLKYSELINQK